MKKLKRSCEKSSDVENTHDDDSDYEQRCASDRYSAYKNSKGSVQKKVLGSKKVETEFQKREPWSLKRKGPPTKGLLQLKKLKRSSGKSSDAESRHDDDSDYETCTDDEDESSQCFDMGLKSGSKSCNDTNTDLQAESTEKTDGSSYWFSV